MPVQDAHPVCAARKPAESAVLIAQQLSPSERNEHAAVSLLFAFAREHNLDCIEPLSRDVLVSLRELNSKGFRCAGPFEQHGRTLKNTKASPKRALLNGDNRTSSEKPSASHAVRRRRQPHHEEHRRGRPGNHGLLRPWVPHPFHGNRTDGGVLAGVTLTPSDNAARSMPTG